MENINELPQSVQERINNLKSKDILEGIDIAFLMARSEYLTNEEKKRLFPAQEKEEVLNKPKTRKTKK